MMQLELNAGDWQFGISLSASWTNLSLRYGDGCKPPTYINIFSIGHSSSVSDGFRFAWEHWQERRRIRQENKGRIIPLDAPARRIEIEENDVNF